MPLTDAIRFGIVFLARDEFTDKAKLVEQQLTATGQTVAHLTSRMDNLQTGMIAAAQIMAGGAGLVAAVAVTVKAAAELQEQLLNVQKTTELSDEAIDSLRLRLIDLSNVMPLTAEELGRIAAIAGQLGIKGQQNILAFTEVVAQMSQATNLGVTEAANELARISNVFDLPIDQAARLGSAMNALENSTTATAAEIANITRRLGPAAAELGFTAQETLALSATMRDLGISSELAGTNMALILTRIVPKLGTVGRQMGMTRQAAEDLFSERPAEFMAQFFDSFESMKKLDVIKRLRELGFRGSGITRTFLAMSSAGHKLSENIALANEAFEEATSLQREFERQASGLNAQLLMLRNSIWNLARLIGDALIPAATLVVQGFTYFFRLLQMIPKELLATGAVLTLLVGSFIFTVGAIIMLATTMAYLTLKIITMTLALQGLREELHAVVADSVMASKMLPLLGQPPPPGVVNWAATVTGWLKGAIPAAGRAAAKGLRLVVFAGTNLFQGLQAGTLALFEFTTRLAMLVPTGSILLPILGAIQSYLGVLIGLFGSLGSIVPSIFSAVVTGALSPLLGAIALVLVAIAFIKPLVMTIVQVFKVLWAVVGPILYAITVLVGAVFGVLKALFHVLDPITDLIVMIGSALAAGVKLNVIASLIRLLGPLWLGLKAIELVIRGIRLALYILLAPILFFGTVVSAIFRGLFAALSGIWRLLRATIGTLVSFFRVLWSVFADAFKAAFLIGLASEGIQKKIKILVDYVRAHLQPVWDAFAEVGRELIAVAKELGTALGEAFAPVLEDLKPILKVIGGVLLVAFLVFVKAIAYTLVGLAKMIKLIVFLMRPAIFIFKVIATGIAYVTRYMVRLLFPFLALLDVIKAIKGWLFGSSFLHIAEGIGQIMPAVNTLISGFMAMLSPIVTLLSLFSQLGSAILNLPSKALGVIFGSETEAAPTAQAVPVPPSVASGATRSGGAEGTIIAPRITIPIRLDLDGVTIAETLVEISEEEFIRKARDPRLRRRGAGR